MTYRLGRLRPAAPPKHRLAKYLRADALPAPPEAIDFSPKAEAALAQMYGNSDLGDCVVAASAHLVGVATGNATGTPLIATDQQIIDQYSAIGGYVPGRPETDRGCNELDAFAFWMTHGFFDGTRLLGYVGVDATDKSECMSALALFENLFVGFEMPAAWVNPMPDGPGFVWDVAGDPVEDNGHAVLVVGGNPDGLLISTWGMMGSGNARLGLVTWGACAKYATTANGGELYTLLTPDIAARGQNKSPGGVNWLPLLEDFAALGGAL